MNSPPELKLDWCDRKAAEHACKNWHYTGTLPLGKLATIGVWEDRRFIGCVAFAHGANSRIGSPYGLPQTEVCELVRIALTGHRTPVTRIVRVAIKNLRSLSPGLRLIVSYADPEQGHHGGIYQGGNWIYVGSGGGRPKLIVDGKVMHFKSVTSKYGTAAIDALKGMGHSVDKTPIRFKLKYLMPLDEAMRTQIAHQAKPYPKRVKQANEGVQPECGGAAPTHTLQ